MTFTRHYFVDQQYLGTSAAEVQFVHGEVTAPLGHVFFCPICSEAWGRCIVDGQPSLVRHRFCERHVPGERVGNNSMGHVHSFEVPGSLWLDEDRTYNEHLPPAVVFRELCLHLKWASEQANLPIASAAQAVLHYIIDKPKAASLTVIGDQQ